MTTTTQDRDVQMPGRPEPTPRAHLGLIVAASLAAGLVAALALVATPFIPAKENVLTGVVLLAFALGWALLAVLSTRFSSQPQRWAAAPAAFMAVAGSISLLPPGSVVQDVFSWVWPPVLFGLVVWMLIRVRRQLSSRGARWLLYPVLAMLMVASVGGGYQTVRQSIDTKAYPMPGQLVDVGGHRMRIYCTGTGSPTVILEPGQGGASSDSGWVAPTLARDSTVCVYDRAGRGWSDPADDPQDAARIAADLRGYQVVCVNTSKEVSTDDGCRDESAGAGRAGAGDGGGAGRGGQVGPGRFAGRVDGPSRRGLIAIDRGGRVFAGAGEAGVGGGPGCGADRPSGL